MDEYLNSKSMLAPGIAGATTTMITGTLVSQFGFPGNYTALAVSFMLGMVVFSDKTVPVLQRAVFYLVNSMIIFNVAVGLNTAGAAVMNTNKVQERTVETVPAPEIGMPFFSPWF
jgi:hypothetical protein